MPTYKIIRFYAPGVNHKNKVIKTGLTLEEAQAWCSSPMTSTSKYFDGYEKER